MLNTIQIARTGIACAVIALTAFSAHAELQVWRFTGQVNSVVGTLPVPAAFATAGKPVTIDYLIDTSAPYQSFGDDTSISFFPTSVPRVIVNGRKFEINGGNGINIFGGGFYAINVAMAKPSADGLNFMSYNLFTDTTKSTIPEILKLYSTLVGSTPTENRLDFNLGDQGSSVLVGGISFKQVQLPASCKSSLRVKLDPRCTILVPAK
jgi:hypothetical protein